MCEHSVLRPGVFMEHYMSSWLSTLMKGPSSKPSDGKRSKRHFQMVSRGTTEPSAAVFDDLGSSAIVGPARGLRLDGERQSRGGLHLMARYNLFT